MKIYFNSSDIIDQNVNDLFTQFSRPLIGFKKIRLVECKLYNSWWNIDSSNNTLKFWNAEGGKWADKTIPPGNYSIETLAEKIAKLSTIKLKREKATGKVSIIVGESKVDFKIKNNFSEIIGFNKEVVDKAKVGPNKADFLTVKEYIIHCDIIDSISNYVGAKRSDYLAVLPVNNTKDVTEQVIYDKPSLYCSIINSEIYSIRLWITDQNNNKINFHKYPVTYLLELT